MHKPIALPKGPKEVPARLQIIAELLCFVFGLTLLLNTHPLGDGQWYWYATLLHSGQRLYRDMHLALQPLFVLQTNWNMLLFGSSWLTSKIPALIQLIAFIWGLRSIAKYLPLKDWQKAVLICCAFCLSTLFVAYRLDDYHVLADCFEVYSIVLLLHLLWTEDASSRKIFGISTLLGALSGLSITTRLNDGGMLFISVVLSLVAILPARRRMAIPLFAMSAGVTVLTVVYLTGDTLRDYSANSIFKAAGSKGGVGSLLRAPLLLPLRTLKLLITNPHYLKVLAALAIVSLSVVLIRLLNRDKMAGFLKVGPAILPVLALLKFIAARVQSEDPAVALSGVWIFIFLSVAAYILVRALRMLLLRQVPGSWRSTEVLMLIPVGQLLSMSMSTAGNFFGLYAPVGIMLLISPIAWPSPIRRSWQSTALTSCAAIMVASTLAFKLQVPYSWHTYRESPVFTGRIWFQHPLYGPMYISERRLEMMQSVCRTVRKDDLQPELLSLPFPYANYFCGVVPWHSYVQSFYDIASRETITRLTDELTTAPPKWILYQRQPLILELHEWVFNRGNPLPHREMERQIMARLASGQWKKVSEQSDLRAEQDAAATYILIQTRP